MTQLTPLQIAFDGELRGARQAQTAGNATAEWRHLERAHILSQPSAWLHTRSHLKMLGFAVRHRDVREVSGQLFRLVVAAPASLAGRYPIGNTGAARVPATKPMPIPDDLKPLLSAYTKASS